MRQIQDAFIDTVKMASKLEWIKNKQKRNIQLCMDSFVSTNSATLINIPKLFLEDCDQKECPRLQIESNFRHILHKISSEEYQKVPPHC